MTPKNLLKIGTRDSRLALWQAGTVQALLEKNGYSCVLVPVKSEGDLDLVTPLYAMGVEGVFTKTLDAQLLSGKIDIAVHSMKDVPIQLARGIQQAAVLPRARYQDLFVYQSEDIDQRYFSDNREEWASLKGVVATGSVRRRAQLLHRFPQLRVEELRGNVQTRLQKLQDHNWDAAIFAAAGLDRLGIKPANAVSLEWMLPAPAQGAIMVVCRDDDPEAAQACLALNEEHTALCTRIERDFLKSLMGGCSTPISALAEVKETGVVFKGNILSPDGRKKLEIQQTLPLEDPRVIHMGTAAAESLWAQGAGQLVTEIRNFEK